MVTVDGQRLRRMRREHGLSQEMLAEMTGVSLTTVGRLERQDRSSCRGRTLARLAAALGQVPADLRTDDRAPGC
jgi:transcriptional regulator with XRE-family HTH domain